MLLRPGCLRPAVAGVSLLVTYLLAGTAHAGDIPGGVLNIVDDSGQVQGACPLKHTDVTADIAGFVARTTVRQEFHNTGERKIEAVYVFPLPQDAAVDALVMVVGDRRIVGQIKERQEAREIYEQAKAAGHVASLLDRERPNIFTQSVANIEPGAAVTIEISYVETLRYDDGVFEWVFPMVVGPRYIPGGGSAPDPMTPGQDTAEVPDASKVTPPVTPKGTRAGHDISLTVHLDAGMPLHDVQSELHDVDVADEGEGRATITLKDQAEIPNRDLVLQYRVATDQIGDAFLVHEDERGRFFALILQPPRRVVPAQLVPRELIFVLDTSGSMRGFPMEKSKEVMQRALAQMGADDTFNIITFAGNTSILWDEPRPATAENVAAAQKFVSSLEGRGGTEMMSAINAALSPSAAAAKRTRTPAPIRVVCFLTDGYVGNDMAIVDAVQRNADTTRVFSFGIGNSVNRFLLDKMAQAGRGEVEYVTLASQADAAVERFDERVLAPVLTDVEIDWGTLSVADVFPQRIPDLFSAKPITVYGRLTGPAEGQITLRGNTGAGPYESPIAVSVPPGAHAHQALAVLWARENVEHLMMMDYDAAQRGTFPDDLKQTVTALGVEFGLVTQFTSFVAVEEMTVTVGGEPVRVNVPVEMPAGVSYEGVFGGGATLLQSGRKVAMHGRMIAGGGAAPAIAGAARPSSEMSVAPAAALGPGAEAEKVDLRVNRRAASPAEKVAEELRGLAEKLVQAGANGTLTIDGIKVTDYRVTVMVFLSDAGDAVRAKLKELGFEPAGESKTMKMLVGTVDVRKLTELADLTAVVEIRAVKS